LPVIGAGKLDKKPLRRDAWLTDDVIWWRPNRSAGYTLMTAADREALRKEFVAHDRIAAHPH
jgi:fatty-acyl-CoA synthase